MAQGKPPVNRKHSLVRNPDVFAPTFPGVIETKYVPPAPAVSQRQAKATLLAQTTKRAGANTRIQTGAPLAPLTAPADYLGGALLLAPGSKFSQTNVGKAVLHGNLQGFKDTVAPPHGGAGQVNAGMAPLLFGKGFRGGAGKLPRAVAETKVAEAAKVARTQGYGRAGAPAIPRLKPGEVTLETGGQTGAQVREALRGSSQARAQQKELYRAERAKRFGKAEQALKQEDPNVAFPLALGHFKGELPKINFQGFTQIDQKTVDAIIGHIKNSPVLDVPAKVRGYKAIQNAVGGVVPTASEQRVLERVFGRETTQDIVKSVPFWKRLGRGALSVVNVPRTIQASFDLSFPLRQGLVAAFAHPRIWASELGPMVKMARSPAFFEDVAQGIKASPNFPLYEKMKLSFTGFGESLADREEPFMSRLLQKVPGIGHGVRFSERGYVGMANKLRADLADDALIRAARNGVNVNDPHELESIGKVINAFTGRGDLGKLQAAAPLLNTVFFSPRLFASRLNLIFGVGEHGIPGEYYMALSPFARREALRGVFYMLGGLSTALTLAKLSADKAGVHVSVNSDPRNADFAKLRIGNTRVDLAGGFQQPIRLVAQIAPAQLGGGKIISSTTGKTLTLGPQGPGKLSRKDIVQRFFEGKYAPVPALINEFASGRDFQGNPVTVKSEAYSRLTPLLVQDLIDLYHEDGAAPIIGGAVLGGLGVGLQTYKPRPAGKSKPKPSSGSLVGGDSSSGSLVRRPSSGGGRPNSLVGR